MFTTSRVRAQASGSESVRRLSKLLSNFSTFIRELVSLVWSLTSFPLGFCCTSDVDFSFTRVNFTSVFASVQIRLFVSCKQDYIYTEMVDHWFANLFGLSSFHYLRSNLKTISTKLTAEEMFSPPRYTSC